LLRRRQAGLLPYCDEDTPYPERHETKGCQANSSRDQGNESCEQAADKHRAPKGQVEGTGGVSDNLLSHAKDFVWLNAGRYDDRP
jgi:hypothetical protein